MSREVGLCLEDIVTCCNKVRRYTQAMSFSAFVKDDRTYDAVVRNLEVIGEAAKKLPKSFRDQNPEIAWRKIAGLRDVLAHGYFDLEAKIIWDVVENHVPALRKAVKAMLKRQ